HTTGRDDDIVHTEMIVKDASNVVVEKAKKLPFSLYCLPIVPSQSPCILTTSNHSLTLCHTSQPSINLSWLNGALSLVQKYASNVAVEKAKKLKQKRKAAGDASGSTLLPKKLREDYHAETSSAIK
nr:hypothetical protein [Tanacetum cinerariifolium]